MPTSPTADEQLAEDHPAAAAAEPAEHRRVDAIDDRRPEELQRIGQPDPRQEADRRQRRARVAQPVAERVAAEKERQAGREAEHEHHRHLRLAQRRDHVALADGGLDALTTSLLQLREQRQRFHRRHVIDVERRELLAQPRRRRAGAWNSPSWRCGSDGVPLTDGRPPRVSSSRSSAPRISRARVDDRRRQPGEPRDLDAVAAIGSAGHDLAQEDDVVLPLARRRRGS